MNAMENMVRTKKYTESKLNNYLLISCYNIFLGNANYVCVYMRMHLFYVMFMIMQSRNKIKGNGILRSSFRV